MKKKFYELKQGEKIVVFGEPCVIKKMEFSGQGIKQGRAKCRIEAENGKKEKKVIVRLSDELIDTV